MKKYPNTQAPKYPNLTRALLLGLWVFGSLGNSLAGTFHCTWNFSDFTTGALGIKQVQIQTIAPYGVNTNTLITGDVRSYQTSTNSSLTVSNLVNGRSYRVRFFGLTTPYGTNWITTVTNNFSTNVTGLVNATDYLAVPTIVDAATLAYSQAAADARFLRTNITQYVLPGTNVVFVTNANTVTISSTASSGSGSATNVFFTAGQSTTPRVVSGSNTFDVVGTLTNSITGNAATATLAVNATDADFATEATKARGLLDTDSADAVTVTLTKIIATSGHDYAGSGSGLTNVPSKWFDSIAAMTNSTPVSNLVVHVWSYFGTNWEGGGVFAWENSSATADLGQVFYGTSGRWRRVDTGYPTNYVFMENFGVVPNAVIDQYAGAQAAINATPFSEGKLILPDYNFAVGTTLTWTNRRGCYFGTRNAAYVVTPGYRVYPNPTCVIHWVGVSGGTNLVAYDVGHNTFRGFGLDTRIGLNNWDQYTNAAGLLMDVDMNTSHSTTTTANVFDGMYFRERHTNSALVGLRIASYNWQNCEFFQFANCSWQGGGANIPEYWISTTNIGASKAIQLGGNGGGLNSFNHTMRNCGFDRWQYFIHSTGGQWDIEGNYGTAAGAAAYYLNCDGPCYIRGTRDEGDHQFVVSPSTHPVTLSANQIAMTTGMSVANVCPVDVQNLVAFGNKFQHEATIPSITNSFNSTGWYLGSQNSFCNTNDALIASWRFNSSFNSHGDFGTVKDNNNIQSGPWKTPSATQTTNVVFQRFTDGTASTMALTMMPSNGVFGVGSYLNNVHAGFYNPDLDKTSMQFGDSVINPRFKLLPSSSGLITELQLFGSNSVWLELYNGTGSSATRLDFVGSSAVNKIHARTGSLKITGTNDTDLLTFGTDYKIKFPYDTNFEVVGRIGATRVTLTNSLTFYTNNGFASLDATPTRYGQITLANSNTVIYQATATTSGTLAWASTNRLLTAIGGDNADNIASGTIPYARSGSLTNHNDVVVTSLTAGDHLAYDSATSKWTNGPSPAGGGAPWIRQIFSGTTGNNSHNVVGDYAAVSGVSTPATSSANLVQLGPNAGYISNLTFWVAAAKPTTTNIVVKLQTNSITANGGTMVTSPITLTLAGGTGVNWTNSGTAAFTVPSNMLWVIKFEPTVGLSFENWSWSLEWWHQ